MGRISAGRRAFSTLRRATLGAVLMHGAARAADLSVCIDQASPTEARDQRIAEAVARAQGATLTVYHFDGSAGGDDSGMRPRAFKKLAATNCQLVLGFPIDMTDGGPPPDLQATAPYDQSGFVLATAPPYAARDISGLPKGASVSVTYLAAPELYLIEHPDLQTDIEENEKDTLQTLVDGKVKAAIVWQATLAHYIEAHPGARFNARPLTEPHLRWNVVALYAARSAAAATAFDSAIASLKASGAWQAILAPKPEHHAAIPFIHLAAWQATPSPVASAAGPGGDASLPTLFTQAQADDGMAQFSANCAQCHGDHLEGRAGPGLKGPNFASAKSDFTVSDVFHIVSQNMPATQPGSLAHDDYVQIMAFLLQQNGYPAGKTALTFDNADSSTVPLRYHGT